RLRRAHLRLPGQRRVRDAQGRRAQRLAGRARLRAGGAGGDPPRRRRRRAELPRAGRGALAARRMIRRADPADIPAIAALAAASGDDGGDPAGLPARLARILEQATHAVFLAEDDNGPCGFAAAEHRLSPDGERVELTCLAVDAAARRRGVGSQLVAATEAWARRRGVDRVQVAAALSREAAHAFCPALGYARVETRQVYLRTLR